MSEVAVGGGGRGCNFFPCFEALLYIMLQDAYIVGRLGNFRRSSSRSSWLYRPVGPVGVYRKVPSRIDSAMEPVPLKGMFEKGGASMVSPCSDQSAEYCD